jgi:hypothetical protein
LYSALRIPVGFLELFQDTAQGVCPDGWHFQRSATFDLMLFKYTFETTNLDCSGTNQTGFILFRGYYNYVMIIL